MKFLIGYLVGSFSASFVYFIFLKITYGICKSSTEEIAELEKQVEKMKSCDNCKNFCVHIEGVLEKGRADKIMGQKKVKCCSFRGKCKNKDLWELKDFSEWELKDKDENDCPKEDYE